MENNADLLIFQSVFKIGTVCSVDGREVKVKVDKLKNSSHLIFKGELVKNVSVGSYVKILKGFIPLIAKVESKFIVPIKDNPESKYPTPEERINRELKIKLLGYFENNMYRRGIKELPLIDNDCYLLANEEFTKIHSFFKDSNDVPLKIGALASDPFVSIELGVSRLFSSHIGIFGNTGSGKSYTLSKLYHKLFEYYDNNDNFKKNAKFLFFDFNGEYGNPNFPNTITPNKKVYNLSTKKLEKKDNRDKLPLTNEDLLNPDILCIFANATEKTQKPFIKRCIDLLKKIEKEKTNKIEKEKHFRNILRKQIKEVLCMSEKTKSDLLIDCIYSNPQLAERTELYRQVDLFSFSDNFIDMFICMMYIQLIYDVLGNRAMNEHIAPAIVVQIDKIEEAYKPINETIDVISKWLNINDDCIETSKENNSENFYFDEDLQF